MDKQKNRRLKRLRKQMDIINQSIEEEKEWMRTHPPFMVDKGKVKPFPVY